MIAISRYSRNAGSSTTVPGMSPGRHPRADAQASGEKAPGVAIAQGAPRRARLTQGAYIMPPFNKVELAVRVIEPLS
jgi:hypothetical protein